PANTSNINRAFTYKLPRVQLKTSLFPYTTLFRSSIIRPTNIWGPRHPFFPHELWRYLERGYYVHPGLRPTPKYYGYVTNAVAQIDRKSTRLNSSHVKISYAVFCLKQKTEEITIYS